MTLEQYRQSKNLGYSELARLLGASHATVARRWCLPVGHPNKQIPNTQYMLAILAYTSGAVQPNDFYLAEE